MLIRILSLFLVGTFACCNPATHETVTTSGLALESSGPLYFSPEAELSLDQVVRRVERSVFDATGSPPAVFVEYVPKADTQGTFILASKYVSLSTLAEDMEAQEPTYQWEVADDSVLLIYPKKSSFFTTTIGPFSMEAESFCDVVKQLGVLVRKPISERAIQGCMVRGAPKYVGEVKANILPQKWGLGSTEPPFLIKLPADSTRVVDVVLELLRVLDVHFGASVVEVYPGLTPTWILSL